MSEKMKKKIQKRIRGGSPHSLTTLQITSVILAKWLYYCIKIKLRIMFSFSMSSKISCLCCSILTVGTSISCFSMFNVNIDLLIDIYFFIPNNYRDISLLYVQKSFIRTDPLFLRKKPFNVTIFFLSDYQLRWWRLPFEERICRRTRLGGICFLLHSPPRATDSIHQLNELNKRVCLIFNIC